MVLYGRETHGRYDARPKMQHLSGEHRKHKKGSHTYSRELVKKIGCGLELSTDEIRGFVGVAGILKERTPYRVIMRLF